MSHASGQVLFKDGTIFHFEYDGTCDIVRPKLYKTFSEMWDNWRSNPDSECTCGKDEKVEIADSYGDGTCWNGKACKKCMTVTKGIKKDWSKINHHGLPDWWESRKA